MTMQNIHPGGFLWYVSRAERSAVVLRLASAVNRLGVIVANPTEATAFAERLTLSGVPVLEATDVSRPDISESFRSDSVAALVTTDEYLEAHGPIRSPLAVHLRVPKTIRSYAGRLSSMPAAAHITFTVPEDTHRADALKSYLSNDRGHEALDDIDLREVVDLTNGAAVAEMSMGRRRFPLRG